MKKNFKYLLVGTVVSLFAPLLTNAANFSLKENTEIKEKSDNVQIYDIIYTPGEETINEVKIDLTKTNNNLTYNIEKNENSGAVGECNSFPCPLSLDLITSPSAIVTITITNTTETEQKTIMSLSGDITGSEPVTATLKPMVTTTTTTSTETTKVLNNEATLSGITLSVGSMDQAFSSDLMEYNVTGIKDTVNSVTITPNCENNCTWSITCPTGGCSISNTRRVTLQNGANKVAINVTSEDGSANKTYILNMYKGEVVSSSAYLSEIKINDGTISPNFDSMVNDYTITVGIDVEKLDIITTTEDPSAEVVIKGNEKLVEGENTVTITVTSSDGENKQVYTILVIKEEVEEPVVDDDEEKEIVTTPVKKKNNNTWLIILLSLLGLGLIIVVFLIIFKNKKRKKKKDNDNNKPSGPKKEEIVINKVELENTESLNILNETNRIMSEEPKQNIDDALDDLMQTKRLELGDLNF